MAAVEATPADLAPSDPFEDHSSNAPSTMPPASETGPLVLPVDRHATLTLGTDALIVLDEGLRHRRRVRNMCGLLPQLSKTTWAIPFYHVLWAELDEFEVLIRYAHQTDKRTCTARTISYAILDKSEHAHARGWVEALMSRAYPPAVQRRKRIKALVNPFGGQGYAARLWSRDIEPIFLAAQCVVDVQQTAYKAHAVEIAEALDIDAYDVVACASGDGLPHEVFNGLARHKRAKQAFRQVAVAQLPCGSGNAMCWNLNGTDSPSLAALAVVKGVRSPLDLMAITQGSQQYYSFLSQAVGIIAESDLGTESLRWMGAFRFTWGILVRLLGKTIYPAEVAVFDEVDDMAVIGREYRRAVERHTLSSAQSVSDDDLDVNSVQGGDEDGSRLPPLRFGTVLDPLPKGVQLQDLPDLGNFYVGKMCYMAADTPFFTASLPSDGRMDMINISGRLPRLTALKMLTTIDQGTLPMFPDVGYRKVAAYRIVPRVDPIAPERRWRARLAQWLGGSGGGGSGAAGRPRDGLVAVDGESVPFEPFQVEVMPRLATVISKRRGLYEFDWTHAP